MNRNKWIFACLILSLVLVITVSAYGMMNIGKKDMPKTISVIVDDSNSDRWSAMKEGMEQVAADEGVEISFVSTGQIGSVEEERDMIDRELNNHVNGLILQLYSSDSLTATLENLTSKTALVLVDTDSDPEEVYSSVTPDNLAIGKALGDAVKTDLEGDLQGKTVGILTGNQSQLSMQQRLKGLEHVLLQNGAVISWKLGTSGQWLGTELSDKAGQKPVEVMVSLGNPETETAVDYLNSSVARPCLLVGEGSSEKLVYYLDKGLISSLVVPNEFNMGYESAMLAVDRIKMRDFTPKNKVVDYRVINRDNLYDAENQKILFPIVQ